MRRGRTSKLNAVEVRLDRASVLREDNVQPAGACDGEGRNENISSSDHREHELVRAVEVDPIRTGALVDERLGRAEGRTATPELDREYVAEIDVGCIRDAD